MLPIVKGHKKHTKTVKSRMPLVYEVIMGGIATDKGGRSNSILLQNREKIETNALLPVI